MFGYYMKRILKSRIFYICIAISAVILIIGCFPELMLARELASEKVISLIKCIDTTMDRSGIYGVIAPALISATFLFFYTEELERRAVYYQLLRTNRKKYYRGQILSALASACLIIVISSVVFTIVCSMFGVVLENVGWFVLYEDTNIAEYFYGDNTWKITIWYGVLVVLYCLPWPLFGMLVSLFTKNKYIVLAAPFVIFMAWNYITQLIYSVFHNILWVNPMQPLLLWGLPFEEYWSIELTILYPVIYHIILIGGLSLVFLMVTRRRFLREGI